MNRIKQELYALSGDIHKCLSSLVKARLDKDTEAEARAIDDMERLLASTQHVCSYVIDELPENNKMSEVVDEINRLMAISDTTPDDNPSRFQLGKSWAFQQILNFINTESNEECKQLPNMNKDYTPPSITVEDTEVEQIHPCSTALDYGIHCDTTCPYWQTCNRITCNYLIVS